MLNLCECYKNYNLYNSLSHLSKIKKEKEIVFLCVGNPKIWFDSFGPIIGSVLKNLNIKKYIYGNTRYPIVASNLKMFVDMIYRFHVNPYIIVFDNAISNCLVPTLKIKEGPVNCAVLSDESIEVGDLSIIYCFNKENIKNCNNYYEMFKEMKKLLRFLLLVLNT